MRANAVRWDVGLAPLVDSAFNRSKSDLKWLEYTGLGLPGVFSDVDPYGSVEDRRTGRLAADDPEAWANAILTLRDADDRESIAHAARDEVMGERLLRHQVDKYLDLLFEVTG